MKMIILVFNFFIASLSYGQTSIWLVGTSHEPTNYINPDSLTAVLDKIQPDLILIELEDKHFTKDFKFDTTKYPLSDFLSNNENIASYRYQQQKGVQLRPFDINGRHDFYEKEKYHEQENKMFGEMLKLYKQDKFSPSCKIDFDILLSTLTSYSELHFNSLREANSDVTTKFLALKNQINFELMVSITKRTTELKHWLKFAELRKEYWNKRNKTMVDNIIKYATEFKEKHIVIFVGNDHKYALTEMLSQRNFLINNFYD